MVATFQYTGVLGAIGARLARFQLAHVPTSGRGGRGYGVWAGWYLMADEARRTRQRGKKKKKKRVLLDEDIKARQQRQTTSLALFLAEV